MSEELEKRPTLKFAKWTSQLRFEDIPREVGEYTKLLILDSFGIAILGSTMVLGRMLTNHIKEFGANGRACIWGDGFRSDVMNAAMANGAFMHCTELEDCHRWSFHHATCATVPAAMAFADQYGASGQDLITAVTAGIEVTCRIGVGTRLAADANKRGWHAVGALGGFGGAITFGKLLQMDEKKMAQALSLGGTQPVGIWATCYDMSKRFHAGKGASNGVLAALLANRGVTGGTEILEAKHGSFSQIMCDNFDLGVMTRGLGREWETSKTALKPYPCKRAFHTAIDGLLKIVKEHNPHPDQIERIIISSGDIVTLKPFAPPVDQYDAQINFPFLLAVAVYEGDMFIEQLRTENLKSKAINEFAAHKIKFESDPELTKDFPRTFTARCFVKMKNGKEFKAEFAYPLGEPENPMSKEEAIQKFRRTASYAIDDRRMDQLIERVSNLEKEGNAANLTPLLHL